MKTNDPWRLRIAYPALLSLGALDAAGYSVIAPVTPAIAHATGAGPALIGALVASFPVGIMIGFGLAARGIKRGFSRAVLLGSFGLIGLGCVGFIAGQGLSIYFVARFVMGLGSGGVWMGVTFGTLERWPGQEYICMSRIFSAYSVGALIGPALGAIGGIRGPFSAYLALVSLGGALVLLMESPAERRAFDSDRDALRLRGFWLAAAGILFAVLGLGTMEGILPLHFATRLTQPEIGAFYAGTSLVVAASAALAARFRPRRIVLVSTALVIVGVTLAGATSIVPAWMIALVIAGIGIGIANTGSIGLLLDAVSTDRIVTAMVVWSQIGIIGYLLGPLAGGAVASGLGFGFIGVVPIVASMLVFGAAAWAGPQRP